jgi:hypothetical protein
MVGVLEMNEKLSRKERFLKWWSLEKKIEISASIIMLIVLIAFWGNLLVEGVAGILVSLWCLGKIYFRRDKWVLLIVGAAWTFQQGMSALLHYFRG